MSATPPEANLEYSIGPRHSSGAERARARGDSGSPAPSRGPASEPSAAASTAIFAGGLLGALLLVVAEFTTLFTVHTSTSTQAIQSVGTGGHHTYALIPIGLLVVLLAYGVWSAGSRPALLAIGVLGVIALLIALLGDLPDAHASGLLGSPASHFTSASSTPSAGLYMETLGAVILIITSVCGFLLLGPPSRGRRLTAARLSGS
jgi:hypothetical protein